MFQPQNIIRRIFANRKIPENLSNEEYDAFLQSNFLKWITEFEQGGFLEQTKLPAIQSEEDFIEKLQEHKDDLMVIKFWKHGCIPCLSLAEMYKSVAEQCARDGKRVYWYSVDTKSPEARELVDYQLVVGTPTLQTFSGERQVGNEIRATNADDLVREIDTRMPKTAKTT